MINKLLIVGSPASGKTTVATMIEELCGRRVKIKRIDDFEMLKRICPREKKSGKYYYTDDGSIVVVDKFRLKIMKRLSEKLHDCWYAEIGELVVVEMTSPKLADDVQEMISGKDDYLVVYVGSEADKRQQRNEIRYGHVIPDEYMKMFDEDYLNEYDELSTKVDGDRIYLIDNRGTLGDLRTKVEKMCQLKMD